MSSNPQEPRELVREIEEYLAEGWTCPPDAKRMLALAARLIADLAGYDVYCEPVTPQASSAEHSEESLVSAVAEALRDFKFEVGPITLEMLKVGQAVYLTPEERHQIAHAAVRAYRQVVADE